MKLLERIINKKNYLWDTFLGVYYPKLLADKLYKRRLKTSHGINGSNPKDLNEKINYLKFNSDTTEWSRLADKYAVRDFVTAKLGG